MLDLTLIFAFYHFKTFFKYNFVKLPDFTLILTCESPGVRQVTNQVKLGDFFTFRKNSPSIFLNFRARSSPFKVTRLT